MKNGCRKSFPVPEKLVIEKLIYYLSLDNIFLSKRIYSQPEVRKMSSIDLIELNELNEKFVCSIEESKKRLQKLYKEIQGDDQESIYLKELIEKVLNEHK